ncbi:yiaY [Symbiodinium sp. CCMP2592]|nr:yiaY [Symbiodinium sp. CCMP2592]
MVPTPSLRESLTDPNPSLRLRALDRLRDEGLFQEFRERVISLIDDPSCEVSSKALALLREKMTSADPFKSETLRVLFKKKVSKDVLEQNFQKIVPSLLADPRLQLWSFEFLKSRTSVTQLIANLHVIVAHFENHDWLVKRRTLEFILEQLPGELDAGHVHHMVALLANSDWRVRKLTIDLLERRAPSSLIAEHWEILFALVADPTCEVQEQTLNLLEEKMPSELIAEQFTEFHRHLRNADPRIRKASRQFFRKKISADILARHFPKIVPALLADSELQAWSFAFLSGRISSEHLPDLIDWIVVLLASQEHSWNRQRAALEFMKEQLPSGVLSAKHFKKIVALLGNSACKVKKWTLDLLQGRMPHRLLAVLLAEHGEKIWPLSEHEDPSVQAAASRLVLQNGCSLSKELVMQHSQKFAALLYKRGDLSRFEQIFPHLKKRRPQHPLAELLLKLPVSRILAVVLKSEDVAGWRDKDGNTWLHVAAEAGHLEACEALVDVCGVAVRAQNKAGDEPLALAASREVDRFLRSRMGFRETRFGYGNAFDESQTDRRQVGEVTWYTVPLRGMAGHCGGLHSFLVVTVSADTSGAKTYVLEKAGSQANQAHQRNGIFVGSQDLSSNLKSVEGLKMYKTQLSLSDDSLRRGLKMKELYEKACGTGPYHLATSNCHHAAQSVYNHCCATEQDQEARPPNEWLAKLGSAIQLAALFDSSRSSSESSGSDVASSNSELASGSQLADSPSGFSVPLDLASDAFAEMAAALCHAVYDDDAARVLSPSQEAVVSIRNQLARPVLVYDHNSKNSHRVEADEVLNIIAGCGTEKILVDVYAVAWVPGLYPHRRLAQRKSVWSGHAYSMFTDFRSDVMLQEVAAVGPRQPVEVLYATKKSRSASPVQWLLARSCSVLYAAFRGTDDVQDAAIDLCAVPDCSRFREHGMGVHSGIAHALEQEGDEINHVVRDVLGALEEHRQPEERLVLCGHSLGGGYAQVMAVHLLTRKVEVSAIRTFGAPHVLVPQHECPRFWRNLHSITQHWVHDWDPVPRLPLCKTWLVDVLPKLKQEVVTGVRLGIAERCVERLRQNYDRTKARMLEKYDVVGKVVLVSLGSDLAFGATQDVASLKGLLGEKPPGSIMTFSRLFAYHSMGDYLKIARKLTSA